MLDPIDWLLLLLMPIFLINLSQPIKPSAHEDPHCFPDYRPKIKCQAFEKLPY